MSTIDSKDATTQNVSSPDVSESTQTDASKSAKLSGCFGYTFLFFIFGFIASLFFGWVVYPKLLYSKKHQPIDFNHAVHMELVEEGCNSCHTFREDGTYAGTPKLAQCIGCHNEVQSSDPDEIKFVEEYVQKGVEVPWLSYSKQPDCVFFSHAAHVKVGKMDCVTCHGHIGESTSLKVYEENRLTGYSRDIWGTNIAGIKRNSWDRMKMDDCANCHMEATGRKTSVQTEKDGCFVCHK